MFIEDVERDLWEGEGTGQGMRERAGEGEGRGGGWGGGGGVCEKRWVPKGVGRTARSDRRGRREWIGEDLVGVRWKVGAGRFGRKGLRRQVKTGMVQQGSEESP